MDKPEIVKLFLGKGHQIDEKGLEYIFYNQEKIGLLLNLLEIKQTKEPIITFETIKQFLEKPLPKIEIVKKKSELKKTLLVENYVNHFNKKYEKIKKILESRLDLVNPISIGKISNKTKKFSIIVFVKEKFEDNRSILAEDSTGETVLFFKEKAKGEFNNLLLDDLIGLVCERINNEIYIERTVWPDIPLKREINKTKDEIYCLFLSGLDVDDEKFKKESYKKFLEWIEKANYENLLIFSFSENGIAIMNKNDIVLGGEAELNKMPLPLALKIGNQISILLANDRFLLDYKKTLNTASENTLLSLLKRRDLDPSLLHGKQLYEDDPYSIDTVPDIFVSDVFGEISSTNYKSTSLLSTGSFLSTPFFWLVNLKNREVIKLDFT